MVEAGVNRELRHHGVDVVGGAVVRNAAILRIDEDVVLGAVVGEASGGVGSEKFVDGVKEGDGAVVSGVMGVPLFVEEMNSGGKPFFLVGGG